MKHFTIVFDNFPRYYLEIVYHENQYVPCSYFIQNCAMQTRRRAKRTRALSHYLTPVMNASVDFIDIRSQSSTSTTSQPTSGDHAARKHPVAAACRDLDPVEPPAAARGGRIVHGTPTRSAAPSPMQSAWAVRVVPTPGHLFGHIPNLRSRCFKAFVNRLAVPPYSCLAFPLQLLFGPPTIALRSP